jgi:hypothetical protein
MINNKTGPVGRLFPAARVFALSAYHEFFVCSRRLRRSR